MDGAVECEQCGRYTFPHSKCRCRECGIRHAHHLGCRRVAFCPQCCRTTRVHGICDCVHCHSRHQTSLLCRARPANRHFRAAMSGVNPQISNIGSMSVVCPYCGARSWLNEKISCCASGDIQLPGYPAIPVELTSVILSAHVRQNIRLYNMSLAMASVGHRAAGLPDGMFVLGGQACHRIGSLAPSPGCPPAFAQIYVLDADAAALRRMQVFGRDCPLKRDVLRTLHELLIQHNPCVRQFVAAARSNVPRFSWSCFDDISGMQVGAMVIEPGERRDIVVQRVCGPLMFIHDGHSLFHPLSYPLLFPLGTHGWRESLQVLSVDCASRQTCDVDGMGPLLPDAP